MAAPSTWENSRGSEKFSAIITLIRPAVYMVVKAFKLKKMTVFPCVLECLCTLSAVKRPPSFFYIFIIPRSIGWFSHLTHPSRDVDYESVTEKYGSCMKSGTEMEELTDMILKGLSLMWQTRLMSSIFCLSICGMGTVSLLADTLRFTLGDIRVHILPTRLSCSSFISLHEGMINQYKPLSCWIN